MQRHLWLLWTVALVATVRPASASILAQAVPAKYSLTVREAETISRDVAIRNLGDAPVVVKVRLSDWTMDEAGDMSLVDPGTTPVSLQGSIEFEPRQFSLGPGESGVIHVVLHLPAQGPATRYGVLLSEVRPTIWPKAQLGPRAIAELGTTFYLSRIPADLTRAPSATRRSRSRFAFGIRASVISTPRARSCCATRQALWSHKETSATGWCFPARDGSSHGRARIAWPRAATRSRPRSTPGNPS